MTDPHHDDGLATTGEAVSAVPESDASARTLCFRVDPEDGDDVATDWEERNGPPIHDPGCGCGSCPERSW